jgi:hypothetical protein
MGDGPISSLTKDAKFRLRAYTCLIFRIKLFAPRCEKVRFYFRLRGM